MNIRLIIPIVFAFAFPNLVMPVEAQIVPGTGQQVIECFDDFEDPNWNYTPNLPKSSANIDKTERHPAGYSQNQLFLESLYRGTPDFVRRVDTPAGGIPGSTGSMAMQTLNSGVPGQKSYTFQQDDLIAGVQQKLGYVMPVSYIPSYVCRVYIPPFDTWERRHGSHFGFRADCTTTINKPRMSGKFFKNMGSHKAEEQYWPGFFIQLNMKGVQGQTEDNAMLLMRADERGHEVPGPKITQPGWWTLGMTFTSDGRVHYYAHEGVANLTAKDHLYSNFPYGYKCERTSTYFFNIVNQDDGRTWSTRWIVDDPKVYMAAGSYRPSLTQQVAQTPAATAPGVPVAQAPATVTQPQVSTPQAQATVPQTQPSALQSQIPTVQSQVPAAQVSVSLPQTRLTSANPAQLTMPTAVSSTTPAKPATAATPNSLATPADAAIPKLAMKPTEVSISIPKLNEKPDESVSNAIPKLATEPVKPATQVPAIEESPALSTSPATETPATLEPPATPQPPSLPQ